MKKYISLILVVLLAAFVCAPTFASAATKYVDLDDGPGHTVNVRARASRNSTVLCSITYGSAVNVSGYSGEWAHVDFYNPEDREYYDGYIMSQYLASSVPTDCYWIAYYGTESHRLTSSVKAGCRNLQSDINSYIRHVGDQVSWYPLTLDGICGPNTVEAIRYIQYDLNLPVDGIAGNMTKEYLYKYLCDW